jgi:hypothetical protein
MCGGRRRVKRAAMYFLQCPSFSMRATYELARPYECNRNRLRGFSLSLASSDRVEDLAPASVHPL